MRWVKRLIAALLGRSAAQGKRVVNRPKGRYRGQVEDEVELAMIDMPSAVTSLAIARKMRKSASSVAGTLCRLERQGRVERFGIKKRTSGKDLILWRLKKKDQNQLPLGGAVVGS